MDTNILDNPIMRTMYQDALMDLSNGYVNPIDRDVLSYAPLPDSITDPYVTQEVEPLQLMNFTNNALNAWVDESKKASYFTNHFVTLSRMIMNGVATMARGLVTLHVKDEDLEQAPLSVHDLIMISSYQFRKSYLGVLQTVKSHPDVSERLLSNQLRWTNTLMKLFKTREKLEKPIRGVGGQGSGISGQDSGVSGQDSGSSEGSAISGQLSAVSDGSAVSGQLSAVSDNLSLQDCTDKINAMAVNTTGTDSLDTGTVPSWDCPDKPAVPAATAADNGFDDGNYIPGFTDDGLKELPALSAATAYGPVRAYSPFGNSAVSRQQSAISGGSAVSDQLSAVSDGSAYSGQLSAVNDDAAFSGQLSAVSSKSDISTEQSIETKDKKSEIKFEKGFRTQESGVRNSDFHDALVNPDSDYKNNDKRSKSPAVSNQMTEEPTGSISLDSGNSGNTGTVPSWDWPDKPNGRAQYPEEEQTKFITEAAASEGDPQNPPQNDPPPLDPITQLEQNTILGEIYSGYAAILHRAAMRRAQYGDDSDPSVYAFTIDEVKYLAGAPEFTDFFPGLAAEIRAELEFIDSG